MSSDTESISVSSSEEMTSSSDISDAFEYFGKDDLEPNAIEVRIDQYAKDVLDFSSQYGSDYSISYTALNLTGRPSKYPNYGDFPETFAMRTYGNWWDVAPSRTEEISPQNTPNVPAHDFIVLKFEQFIIPENVTIFETYNPGALIRVWAYTASEEWLLLWEGLPEKCEHKSRKFSPPIRKILDPTRVIRLEFNHSRLEYFTEIDGITLVGKKFVPPNNEHFLIKYNEQSVKGSILRRLENLNFRPCIKENHADYLKDFLVNDLEKFIHESGLLPEDKDQIKDKDGLSLDDMPYEILLKIFSYLDLISLFRVGQVSTLMYEVSTHPILYSDINLKPYWHLTSSDLLNTLGKRARLLKKLDLSWCGSHNSLSQANFKKFIQETASNLTVLRLNSCAFLNPNCLSTVASICDNLKELSLRNYTEESTRELSALAKLTKLERLDLCRTVIDTNLLFRILANNPNLQHLNLAFCGVSVSMDEVATYLAKYNRELISVDMWKSHSLSSIGLQALALCHKLEEVDFGWCLREESSPGESLKCLLKGCPNLKKLFLAAIRSITDRDLENIANYCKNLEQLDLMGVLGISMEKCYEILVKCQKLKLLDLNFVDHLDEAQINVWRRQFNVDIKRTFVPSELSN